MLNELAGTASELFENRAYDRLVGRIGEAGAQRAIMAELQDRDLTLDEWRTYRKVRASLHRKPLGIPRISKEIEREARSLLGLGDSD